MKVCSSTALTAMPGPSVRLFLDFMTARFKPISSPSWARRGPPESPGLREPGVISTSPFPFTLRTAVSNALSGAPKGEPTRQAGEPGGGGADLSFSGSVPDLLDAVLSRAKSRELSFRTYMRGMEVPSGKFPVKILWFLTTCKAVSIVVSSM